MKKIILAILSASFLLSSFVGCADKGTDGKQTEAKAKEVKVWTADINEKILQDKPELYTDFYTNNGLSIMGARNEKESGQITLTPIDGAVVEYNIYTSDLVGASGEVFEKENIQLFNEKYTTIPVASKEYYRTPGMYPDALLPFEQAVKYGENTVKTGQNQTVMVRFDIPENQKAGVYTGSIRLVANGTDYSVPVQLTVYDAVVSETVHSKSAFAVSWAMEQGELDDSMEMRLKYADFLAEYMVSGMDIMPNNITYTDEVIEEWTGLIAQLWENEKISTLRLPKFTMTHSLITIGERELENVHGLDYELSAKLLTKLAEKSLLDGKNYLTKMFIRGMDEPQLNNRSEEDILAFHETAKYTKDITRAAIESWKTAENASFIEELKEALDKIAVVSTDNEIRDTEYISYCPYFNNFQLEEDRETYLANTYNELWWYGCNVPQNPYPNYHIDDSLLSARLLSWMQYDYGVIGNLYWAVDAWYDDGKTNVPNDDYYDITTPLARGEGVLLYPGKPYGIDGPIGSLRLEAIRDGLEEYELLRQMDLEYQAVNSEYSIDDLQEIICDSLYFGMKVSYDLEAFNQARKVLYTLCELSKRGFMITDVTSKDGIYSFTMYGENGVEIKSGNTLLSPVKNLENGNEYKLDLTLSKQNTGLDLTVTADGKSYDVDCYIGSDSKILTAEQIKDDFTTKGGNECTPTVVEIDGEKYVQLKMGAVSDEVQYVLMTNEEIKSVGKDTKKMIFSIYLAGDKPQSLRVQFKYKNKPIYDKQLEIQLKPGMNTLEFSNLYSYNWREFGSLESVYFGFTYNKGDAAALDTVYIKDVSIYTK